SPSIPRSDLSLGASCHRRTADRPGPQRLIWCKDSGILRTTSTERRAAGGDRPRSRRHLQLRDAPRQSGMAKISSEIVPSETLVTGPVINIEKPAPISMEISPPGICTMMDGSQCPSLCATAAAALLLLPEA